MSSEYPDKEALALGSLCKAVSDATTRELRQERDSLRAALRECVEAMHGARKGIELAYDRRLSFDEATELAKALNAALARARKLTKTEGE